jgi:predicted nucleic acid-binding protein
MARPGDPTFVDTWGWCAFADRADPWHRRVATALDERWNENLPVVTTDYVLDETITLIFRRLAFAKAKRLLDAMDQSVERGFVDVQAVSAERFAEAKRLRLKYRDKPRISFTDFTSFVVMRELGLAEVITDDDHFQHVGLGFRKIV